MINNLVWYFKINLLRLNRFKVSYPNIQIYLENELEINTDLLSMCWIGDRRLNRINLIWDLHKNGWCNREIVDYLNDNGLKTILRNNEYKCKDVFSVIKKNRMRLSRKTYVSKNIGLWKLVFYKVGR